MISGKNICIVVGEASGDAQAALVVPHLLVLEPSLHLWGVAGPKLVEAHVEAFIPTSELAVMGLFDVLSSFYKLKYYYELLLREIEHRQPALVILVDYPGWNMKLLKDLYIRNIPVWYHIPPKVWIHGKKRLDELYLYASKVSSILPFEYQYFEKFQDRFVYMGNPLWDKIEKDLQQRKCVEKDGIALIPGSRISEIKRMLPLFLESYVKLHQKGILLKALIPISPILDEEEVVSFAWEEIQKYGLSKDWFFQFIEFKKDALYEYLNRSCYAWVCSGTAALEASLYGVPLSVAYRMNTFTFYLGKFIFRFPWVSLAHYCIQRTIHPEFLQKRAHAHFLVEHALEMILSPQKSERMTHEFLEIRKLFPLNSEENLAKLLCEFLNSRSE